MIARFEDAEKIVIENMRGGQGKVTLLKSRLLPIHTKMYAKIIVPAGASIGYHMHTEDEEIIYCLEGSGKIKTEHQIIEFQKGDIQYTPSMSSHSVINDTSSDLVVLAIVVEK